eukprot:CAMPEP_0177796352 /NCGR_PEP_ID=MMETSP0491_2-20121128/26732_1 /TAXON_ID=63592 /ORGANISM="Tetraselmis chuii, Strain PLY429" /LENGTH=494 /DNA_ID=CAMNT_0019319267 /DNA_START=487 /DNA_END=1972 /DNA_ORIENTATION=+
MSNEAMVHEMLYNPGWQLSDSELLGGWATAKHACTTEEPLKSLPQLDMQELQSQGPEGAAATMRKHMAVVAEQAFWDSVEAGLDTRSEASGAEVSAAMGGGASPRRNSGPAVAERLATLLAELAQEVLKVLPEQGAGKALAEELSASFSVPELLKVLAAGSRGGGEGGQTQFGAAVAGETGAPSVARVTTRALRLLFSQMKLLKLDAANARLRMLSAAIAGGQALQYCASKFSQRHGLRSEPHDNNNTPTSATAAEKLPNAVRWLTNAVVAAADTQGALKAVGLGDSAVETAIAASQASAPEGLRAGRSPAAAAHNLPETLELDARRLHRCQNELQRILVLSACMLLAQQAAGAAGGYTLAESDAAGVKARLSGLLLEGSPNLRDLASELSRAGGGAIAEEGLHAGLQRMLTPGSGALQALRAGLGTALTLLLLFPRRCGGAPVEAELARALGRCGGAPMTEDVKALAAELTEVAAVTEAVHGAVYRSLLTNLP